MGRGLHGFVSYCSACNTKTPFCSLHVSLKDEVEVSHPISIYVSILILFITLAGEGVLDQVSILSWDARSFLFRLLYVNHNRVSGRFCMTYKFIYFCIMRACLINNSESKFYQRAASLKFNLLTNKSSWLILSPWAGLIFQESSAFFDWHICGGNCFPWQQPGTDIHFSTLFMLIKRIPEDQQFTNFLWG